MSPAATTLSWPTDFTFGGNLTAGGGANFTWGPIPNDTGRPLQADIIVCAVITWVIGLVFLALRIYTRTRIIKVFGPSDWCIAFAALCAAGVTASSVEQAARGAGKHSWDVDVKQIPWMTRASWYGILFYSLSLTFTKVSILLLYMRIFTYPGWIKRVIRVMLVAVLAIGAWLVASVSTACIPLEAFWNWWLAFVTPVYCQPGNLWWANSAIHISSDIAIVLLPMPVISTLRLPRRQKRAVFGVFALGVFVIFVSIMRLVRLIQVETISPADASYSGASLDFWTTTEVNTAVSCACLMTLKPLIVHFYPGFLSPARADMSDPTLRQVTARSARPSSGAGRSSRRSLNRPGSGLSAGQQAHPMTEIPGRPRSDLFAPAEAEEGQHEMRFGGDALKKSDIEAQLLEGSVASSTVPDEDPSFVEGTLRPPPQPRLSPATAS